MVVQCLWKTVWLESCYARAENHSALYGEPTEHAKVVRVKARLGRRRAEELAELLDGTSLAYVFPPGPKSPIGRCCACGGEVYCEVTETVDGAIKMPGCVEATRRQRGGKMLARASWQQI